MIRDVDYSPNKKLLLGIEKMENAVGATVGPMGAYVMYDTTLGPKTTKDGVTVVNRFALEDLTENMGAHMLKLASAKTADEAGDGSSSAVLMASELIRAGMEDGRAPIHIKRELEEESLAILNMLDTLKEDISDESILEKIATLSANNDTTLGKIVADSYKIAGKYGLIMVEDGKSLHTSIENKEGYSFKRSFMSPYFVTNPRTLTVEYDNPLVCLYDKKVRFKEDIIPLLDIGNKTKRPILLVCESLEGEALTIALTNLAAGAVKIVAVESPGYGLRRKELLDDMALITQGKSIDNDLSLTLKDIKLEHLGTAKKVLIDKTSTTLFINKTEELNSLIEERVNTLSEQLSTTLTSYEKDKISERMAKLASKLVIIKVGGANSVEVNEIRDRLDDSIRAVKSALEDGIVPGCGKTYWLLSMYTSSNILRRGLRSVIKTVLRNANLDYELITNSKFSETSSTYNVLTQEYVNYIDGGIIDPAKVIKQVIINSISVAVQVLMTKVVIQEDKEKVTYDNNFSLEE